MFVDAGYLFAQGGLLLAAEKLSRSDLLLNASSAATKFAEAARLVAPDARLLRIYWYDGLIRGGQPTAEQTALGRSDNIKLRFGMVNSQGQQKGVDSLIVTDLIELARNQAISDAVIMSGDEDIRVGVQIAATFGVRIHLIGIKPALGSQSPDLVAEADTHREWVNTDVAACLSVKRTAPDVLTVAAHLGETTLAEALETEIAERLSAIHGHAVSEYITANAGKIPQELDRPALASLRNRIGRDLTYLERSRFREALRDAITSRFQA